MARKPPLVPVEEIREAFRRRGWRSQAHCADTIKYTRAYFNWVIKGERADNKKPLDMSPDMQRKISDYMAKYK